MFEFRTLGTIELRAGGGAPFPEPLRHSKRVALLACLSASHPIRLHRRETLIALLWPDLDDRHARGMLRHELYELRRALGSDAFVGSGENAVGVNGDRIWCDARAFEASLQDGKLVEAMALLQGEFLPGLGIDGGAFDRWLDGERARLARRAIAATVRLCQRAEMSGDMRAAVQWARRRTHLAPYDEAAWRHLMSLLDRTGDRAEALVAYSALASRLREDLQIEPDPETRALAEAIRTSRSVGDGPVREFGAARELGDPREASPVTIAFRPVENLTADARHDVLGRRLLDRLAQGVSEFAYIEVVVGADTPWAAATVSTALYGKGNQVEARTRLTETGGAGRVLAAPEPVLLDPAPGDEALDEVVARLMAAVATQFDPRVPIAFVDGLPVRTPTWDALLEFIQGAEAFGCYRFEEAARRLRRANEIDPRFVKAGIFAAIAMASCGDPAGAEALATEALRAGEDTASEYERHFAAWFFAELRGRRGDAYRASMEAIRLTSHPVLLFMAGREAVRMNRPTEGIPLLERSDSGQGWWRNWVEVFEVLGGAFHVLGDHHAELNAVLGGRARYPEALEPMRAEVRARAALGEASAALSVADEALTLPPALVSPAEVAWTAAQELDAHGHPDEGAAARRAALSWLTNRERPTRADRLLTVRLLLESGDVAAAGQRLEALAPFQELDSLGLAGLLAAAAGDAGSAAGAIEQLETLDNPYLSGRHLLHAAGIHAALDAPELAISALRRAFASGLPFGVDLHALPILQPLSAHPEFVALLHPRDQPARASGRGAANLVALSG